MATSYHSKKNRKLMLALKLIQVLIEGPERFYMLYERKACTANQLGSAAQAIQIFITSFCYTQLFIATLEAW